MAGVLVDDAIVEIENIVRHMRMGKSCYQAAIDAADEIGLAVVATSFTIIAVFLPVSFMGGISGQFFKQFGLTIASAVFISLMVARLITPVLAAYALSSDSVAVHQSDGPIMTRYLAALRWCVANRWKTIGAGVVFFLLSAACMSIIPTSFVPPEDFASAQLVIELPPGGTLEDTSRVSAAAAAIMRKSPDVTDVVEFVGGDDGEIRNGYHLHQPAAPFQAQHQPEGMGAADDAVVGPGAGRPIELLRERRRPRYSIVPDRRRSGAGGAHRTPSPAGNPRIAGGSRCTDPRRFAEAGNRRAPAPGHRRATGVSVQSISQTIRIATLGDLPQNGAKFSLSDRQIPIRVSLIESARRDLTTLENLPVPTAAGASVPLKSVADLSFGQGPSAVRRYNQSRRIFLEADMAPGVELGTATKKIYALPTMQHLPQGVHKVETGNTEFMTELYQNFLLAVGAGILMVFAVLVLLFVRVLQPITILSALPLSLGGVILALLLTGLPLSLPVIIGILMLMGIVGKNSILLVDFAIEEMRAGKTRLAAILEAGHKRARPIVMTTVAMVAGMLPVAIGWGGDSDFRGPMAIAVIGGLITSTALTLVIVPAVFTVLDDIERWIAPKASKLLAEAPAGGRRRIRRLRPGLLLAAGLAAALPHTAAADVLSVVNWARAAGLSRFDISCPAAEQPQTAKGGGATRRRRCASRCAERRGVHGVAIFGSAFFGRCQRFADRRHTDRQLLPHIDRPKASGNRCGAPRPRSMDGARRAGVVAHGGRCKRRQSTHPGAGERCARRRPALRRQLFRTGGAAHAQRRPDQRGSRPFARHGEVRRVRSPRT